MSEEPKVTDVIGMKNDDGKPRWGLLPFEALAPVVRVLTFGARKYADSSWRKLQAGKPRYMDATLRHIAAWQMGERKDYETGESPLAHAIASLLFVLAHEIANDKSAAQPETLPRLEAAAPAVTQ